MANEEFRKGRMKVDLVRAIQKISNILLPALVLILAFVVLTWGRSLSKATPDEPGASVSQVTYNVALSGL
jgi:hypothetical protein